MTTTKTFVKQALPNQAIILIVPHEAVIVQVYKSQADLWMLDSTAKVIIEGRHIMIMNEVVVPTEVKIVIVGEL